MVLEGRGCRLLLEEPPPSCCTIDDDINRSVDGVIVSILDARFGSCLWLTFLNATISSLVCRKNEFEWLQYYLVAVPEKSCFSQQ